VKIIGTPHNDFFVQVMSRKDKAIAFFKRYLPPAILELADLNQIELVESHHISNQGVSLYNDILYRCPLGNGQIGYFFAVCEHQANPYVQMPFRLLKYDVGAIETHLRQGHKELPIVANIVVYHGKRPWNHSTALVDYYANPELGAQYLYMAPFTLVNLPAIPAEEIYRDKELGFCFEAFRCTRTPDPYQAFAASMHVPTFQQYFQSLPDELKDIALIYLGKCIDKRQHSLEELINLVATNIQEKERIMTSIAHSYLQQGISKGRQEGRQEGRQARNLEIAKNMLKLHLEMGIVQKATGLSLNELEQLKYKR
jgi:predicted transposase YdaD